MDLITLRDRIRINALTANLTYTEIETLFDVNELNNQEFPCFTWAYRGESGGEDSSSVISCDIYLMDTYPDSVKIETENYQRDYIITRQDALRQYFFDWLPLMNLDSDDYIEMDKYAEVPIAEKIGVNGFIAISYRVGFRIKRPFCFNEGAITPPSQVDVYFNGGLEYEQASNVDLNLTLKNQLGADIDATFTGYDIVVNQTGADANVENSDSSYTEAVPSGDTLVLPNEAITINSVSFIDKPSVKDQNILLKNVSGTTITPVSLIGDTITILDAVTLKGALPLQSGQTTSYAANDDGALRRGRLTDFNTIPYLNPFGNYFRFTDELGGQTFTNNIIIDWSTWLGESDVLGYCHSIFSTTSGTQNWTNWMVNQPYTSATFTNWYVANFPEMSSLLNFEYNFGLDGYPFNIPNNVGYQAHSSTTNPSSTSQSLYKRHNTPFILSAAKTSSIRAMLVRTFTITGTTLT